MAECIREGEGRGERAGTKGITRDRRFALDMYSGPEAETATFHCIAATRHVLSGGPSLCRR